MKKLIGLCLVLVMVLTTAAPVWAAPMEEPDGTRYEFDPEVQAWIDAHPEEVEEFLSSGIETYVRESFEYHSVAEMAAHYDDSDGAYTRDVLLAFWVRDTLNWEYRNARIAAYEAEHPGSLERLEANAYDYFAETYPWFDSPEAYMELWNYSEQEFVTQMVDYQIINLQAKEERKAELGGVPGEIGVMLNGQYISFPDAAPELADGRVMAPYRALMEALGGEVAFDSTTQTATCILGDETLTLTIGESALTIQGDGGSTVVEMDCAAYIKDGRTYVPVRFVSQAFGYDVLWDQSFETAVMLDGAALAAQIDEEFTILNRAIRFLMPEPDQTQSINGTVNTKLTLFDTISGEQTYNFSTTVQSLIRNGSDQTEVQMDLSALRDMFDVDALRGGWQWLYAEEALDTLEAVLNSADSLSLDNLTAGSLCYQVAKAGMSSADSISPILMYELILDAGEQLAGMIGDGCFTRSDQGDTLTLTPASLGLDPMFSNNPFTTMNAVITVADSGAVTGSFTVYIPGFLLQMLTGEESTDMFLDGSFELGKERRTAAVELHLNHAFRVEVEAVGNVSVSSPNP